MKYKTKEERKMKKNLPVIAVSVVAVCLIAVAGVLGFKAMNGSKPTVSDETVSDSAASSYSFEETTTTPVLQSVLESASQTVSDIFSSTKATAAASTTKKNTTATQKPTQKPTEAPTKAPETTTQPPKGDLDPDEMSHSSGTKRPVTASKNLPKDMSFSGLYGSGYDIIGLKPYIFNDDKDPECIQAHLGYNPTYDALAGLIDFSIDTTRIDFKYEGKPYRIQLWKGQYISGDIGTVGGEIGVYTRTPGTWYISPQHYDCAAEEDWLKMEMTILWDEAGDGNYLPQFTRNYDDFWWATGFVDGQLADLNDSNPLRLLGRITFESEEQAQLFAQGLANKGFSSVSTFNPNAPDTYKLYGKDVIFIWQYIR